MQKTYCFLLLLQKTHLVTWWLHRWYALMWLPDTAVPDPDLEIRGVQSPKKFSSALWASVWSKNKGYGAPPQAPPLNPPLCSSESYVLVRVWLCDCAMQFYSKKHISPLLAIKSPVAQWLEHPTRSWRFVGSNPIWGLDFFGVSIWCKKRIMTLQLFNTKSKLFLECLGFTNWVI